MKLVILESPYAGDIVANTLYARRCLHDSLHRGEAPIASHLLYTQPGVLDDDKQHERRLGIDAGLAWRRVANYSVFYTDRGWSPGMLEALELCISERRIYYWRSLFFTAAQYPPMEWLMEHPGLNLEAIRCA